MLLPPPPLDHGCHLSASLAPKVLSPQHLSGQHQPRFGPGVAIPNPKPPALNPEKKNLHVLEKTALRFEWVRVVNANCSPVPAACFGQGRHLLYVHPLKRHLNSPKRHLNPTKRHRNPPQKAPFSQALLTHPSYSPERAGTAPSHLPKYFQASRRTGRARPVKRGRSFTRLKPLGFPPAVPSNPVGRGSPSPRDAARGGSCIRHPHRVLQRQKPPSANQGANTCLNRVFPTGGVSNSAFPPLPSFLKTKASEKEHCPRVPALHSSLLPAAKSPN